MHVIRTLYAGGQLDYVQPILPLVLPAFHWSWPRSVSFLTQISALVHGYVVRAGVQLQGRTLAVVYSCVGGNQYLVLI